MSKHSRPAYKHIEDDLEEEHPNARLGPRQPRHTVGHGTACEAGWCACAMPTTLSQAKIPGQSAPNCLFSNICYYNDVHRPPRIKEPLSQLHILLGTKLDLGDNHLSQPQQQRREATDNAASPMADSSRFKRQKMSGEPSASDKANPYLAHMYAQQDDGGAATDGNNMPYSILLPSVAAPPSSC